MPSRRIVTLTTDFGSQDTHVGQMKAAALAVHPDLTIVDLTHDVPPHDVTAGSYLLWTGYAAFPAETIHVAVVDPGVGTSRRGIVVRTARYTFIAPDNGLLTRVLEEEPAGSAFALEALHYRRAPASPTFDGRDLFAPTAGWIARGTELHHFGPAAGELVKLGLARPVFRPGVTERIRVLLVDRFGNVTLDLPRRTIEPLLAAGAPAPRIAVETPGGPVSELVQTYGDGTAGKPFLLFNSAGHLEVALREARASDRLGLTPGAEVAVTVG
jgi:S-adenosylmethionine hydrolase